MEETKVPWATIALHYITSEEPITIENLAELYSVDHRLVAKKCKELDWVKRRVAVQSRRMEKKIQLGTEQYLSTVDAIEDAASFNASLILDILLGMARRISDAAWSEELDEVKADKLLERLTGLTNSLERVLRLLISSKGGTASRVGVTLTDLLGNTGSD